MKLPLLKSAHLPVILVVAAILRFNNIGRKRLLRTEKLLLLTAVAIFSLIPALVYC